MLLLQSELAERNNGRSSESLTRRWKILKSRYVMQICDLFQWQLESDLIWFTFPFGYCLETELKDKS